MNSNATHCVPPTGALSYGAWKITAKWPACRRRRQPLQSFAFHEDGRTLLCVQTTTSETFVWDLEAGRETLRVPGRLNRHQGRSRRYFTWDEPTGEVRVFDSTGQ